MDSKWLPLATASILGQVPIQRRGQERFGLSFHNQFHDVSSLAALHFHTPYLPTYNLFDNVIETI